MKRIAIIAPLPLLIFSLAVFVLNDATASTMFFLIPWHFLVIAKGRVLLAQITLLIAAGSLLLPLSVTTGFFVAIAIVIIPAVLPAKNKRKRALSSDDVSNPHLNPYTTGGRGLGAM